MALPHNHKQVDFEELLSRDFRPADVVCLKPREKFHPDGPPLHKKFVKPLRSNHHHNSNNNDDDEEEEDRATQRDFVLRLVAQTPAFRQHLSATERAKVDDAVDLAVPVPQNNNYNNNNNTPSLLPLQLTDWESQINWEGVAETEEEDEEDATNAPKTDRQLIQQAKAALRQPRNPFLEHLVLDEAVWDCPLEEFQAKADRVPLILQLGVAGTSVADKVYLGVAAPRPPPATTSAAYLQRVARETTGITHAAAAPGRRGTLHQDKQKLEAFIASRQAKRAQMAKEKTSRIAKAMDALHLGGGRARTITSSLMGPGGTERTGRPPRHMVSGALLEAEYVEQLDMVQNHSLVRDLSKILLRQYHRPKLPYAVVRPDLSWQFQIRVASRTRNNNNNNSTTKPVAPADQHAFLGSVALAKSKFRTEADLSPSEGKLVVLEYCEERPPIQLIKGMRTKIVNYYRGDKAHCPVSAGGGDRPARKKRADETAKADSASGRSDRLPRLQGPDRETTVLDWVGKLPKKKSKDKRNEEDAIDVLPEGVTEIVYPKSHGPFIGEIDEGMTISALVSNMFVAPIFRHVPESSDFLMILTPPSGAARSGMREGMGVILRDFPNSIYCVGQTEPRQRINAPNSPDEKKFLQPFISYQIARALARAIARDGNGLRLDELHDRVLPNAEIPTNALRPRLKAVAVYDKNTSIWTPKRIGEDGYMGVEALSKEISPEGVVAYEIASAASRRLTDLGIHMLYLGDKATVSVGVAMTYLSGQMVSARKLMHMIKGAAEKYAKIKRNNNQMQTLFYEKATAELQAYYKMLKERHDIAQFIYEELQLAPWHLTGEFIDVHKKSEGSGMMQVSGLGDPSGCGEGFSFLRKADTKSAKASTTGNSEFNAQVKKITGTEDDLRKLSMKKMEEILRKFGNMDTKQIKALKRWDRVHVIREISTRAASDRVGVGLERFARDEKFKLSEQKKDYRKKIQTIWKRQIASLSADSSDKGGEGDGLGDASEAENRAASEQKRSEDKNNSDDSSDSDFDDDDLVAELEEEMTSGADAAGLGASRKSGDGDERDAHELAMLMKQREEEKAAHEDFMASGTGEGKQFPSWTGMVNRKVIRRKITTIFPDGTQKTTFKFICEPSEAGKIMATLENQDKDRKQRLEMKYQYGENERPPGHAMFEDQDDFEYSKGRLSGKKRGMRRRAGGPARGRGGLQSGKSKLKIKKEAGHKRSREEEDIEEYNAMHNKKKGTSNRRERGSIRDRRPHVIFAEKLEEIRAKAEARPGAGPFLKPVNRRLIPRYYEVINEPIDLSTIRSKIESYSYRRADALIRDFELMKNNAVKFNTAASHIAIEAMAMYDFVREQVAANRAELTKLEEQVADQMSGKSKKRKTETGSVDIDDLIGDLQGYDSGSGDEAFAVGSS